MKDWIAKYWVDAACGVVLSVLVGCYRRLSKRLRSKIAEDAAIKEGQLALLHDRIYQECTSCIATESITVSQMRNLEYLYRAYHALGGNGTGTELYNRAKALEIRED